MKLLQMIVVLSLAGGGISASWAEVLPLKDIPTVGSGSLITIP